MKNEKTVLVLSLMMLGLASCRSNNLDLSKVQWAPTIEDVIGEPDIKLLVFFCEPEPNILDWKWWEGETLEDWSCKTGVQDWEEIGRIEEPEKNRAYHRGNLALLPV